MVQKHHYLPYVPNLSGIPFSSKSSSAPRVLYCTAGAQESIISSLISFAISLARLRKFTQAIFVKASGGQHTLQFRQPRIASIPSLCTVSKHPNAGSICRRIGHWAPRIQRMARKIRREVTSRLCGARRQARCLASESRAFLSGSLGCAAFARSQELPEV